MLLFLLIGCFEQPDITPPMFIPKSPPDSLEERGIDAHPDNAIYLEWEEPETSEQEGILSYYLYRGKLEDGEYQFKYLDEIVRNAGLLYDSDKYVDYDVNLDTTYYYYLKSHNDFTVSKKTSDTVYYKLVNKVAMEYPGGEIASQSPSFKFVTALRNINRISHFYFRLYYLNNSTYEILYFVKRFRFDFSQSRYYIHLNQPDSHETVLINNLLRNTQNETYLKDGNYRWRVDAIAAELGGAPETEGSESDWMYFTVK